MLDSLSRSGQKIVGDGNLAYLSPQQLDGMRSEKSDDIYSLGAVLYELLTGKPPFHTGELVSQILKSVPPSVSKRRSELGLAGEPLPEAWEKTIAACLEKKVESRPKTAAEVLARLELKKSAAPAAAKVSPEPEVQKQETRRPEPARTAPGSKPWLSQKPAIPAEATVVAKSSVPAPAESRDAAAASMIKAPEAEKAAAPARSAEPAKFMEKKKPEAHKPAEPAKAESKKPVESKGKQGATTPSGFPLAAFVEVEAGSVGSRQRSKFPLVGVAAAVVLIAIGVLGYFLSNSGSTGENKNLGFTPSVESTDSQITHAKNQTPVTAPANLDRVSVPEKAATEKPANKAEPIVVAQASAPKPAAAGLAPGTTPTPKSDAAVKDASAKIAEAQQVVSEKARAAEQARQTLAAAEKLRQEKAAAQKQAQAATDEAQTEAGKKTAAVSTAQKAAEEAANSQKAKAEAQKKAETEAEEAQKLAAEKARIAVEARKAAEEGVMAARDHQAQQQRAAAESEAFQKVVAEKQRIAAEAAKEAADAEARHQQQAQAAKLAEDEVVQAQFAAEKILAADKARKAAEEAETVRLARARDRERLEQQAAAALKAAEEAQRLLDSARKAAEEAEKLGKESELAQKKAEAAAQELGNKPSITVGTSGAMAGAVQPQDTAEIKPPGKVRNPKSKIDKTLENGLGMKFAPVGDVLFCIWPTRVQDFNAFAKATGHKSPAWRDPGFKQEADHPVVNVNWNDAMAFCKWLTEKEQKEGLLAPNQSYRLPTDLEWSGAVGLPAEPGRNPEARDMDVADVYPWGTDWPPPKGAGNYTGEETNSDVAIKNYDDGFPWTSPVGSFKPNKFGLYDMGGNVWQWCEDWWNDERKARVLRGASWYNGALRLSLLSSCRVHNAPDGTTDNYGFRVVIATRGAKK